MLLEQVREMAVGDMVAYKGEARRIVSIILTNTTSPQFLLSGSPDGAISYRVVELLARSEDRPEVGSQPLDRFHLPADRAARGYP